MKAISSTLWRGWSQVWLGCAAIVFTAGVVVQQGQSRWTLILTLACVGVLCLIALRSWRVGVLLLIGWLVVEDLIRKYLGNNMLIYFCKDALFVSTLFSFLTVKSGKRQEFSFRPSFLPYLGGFLVFALVQTFNPHSPSPLYGLLGFRMNFFYLPLLWMGFHLWQTPEDFGRFWTFYLTVGAVVAILGIIQGIVGLDFLNPPTLAEEIRPLAYLVRQAPISGYEVPRPCSVFVSDGRFGQFMLLCLTLSLGLAFALWSYPEWQKWLNRQQKVILTISLALCAVGLVMSGSRGGFVIGLLTLLALFVLSNLHFWLEFLRGRRIFPIVAFSAVLGGGLWAAVLLAPEAVKARWAFYWETLSPASPASELFYRLFVYYPQNFLSAFYSPYALFGQGFGTNSLGIQYLKKFVGVSSPPFIVENGFGNILLETGILGLGLWLLWSFAVLQWAWSNAIHLKGHPFFPLAVSIAWYATIKVIGPLWGGMAGFQEFIGNAFLWLSLGLLGRMTYFRESPKAFSNEGISSAFVHRG